MNRYVMIRIDPELHYRSTFHFTIVSVHDGWLKIRSIYFPYTEEGAEYLRLHNTPEVDKFFDELIDDKKYFGFDFVKPYIRL